MKNTIKRAVALAVVAVMLLCMVPFTYAAGPDFIIAAGEVTGELGDSTVDVPINITKMYTDGTMLGGITVEVNYNTDVFTFDEADWTNGSMVVVPADVILNVMTPGLIRIMFSSATDPITADMVAADSLLGTVRLGIKDTTKPINETLTLTTNDDLYDDMANVLITMDDMADSFVAGKVIIGDADSTEPEDPEEPEEPEDTDVITITKCENATLTVDTGLAVAKVLDRLPDTVKVTADAAWNKGSKTGEWKVTWSADGSNYSSSKAGKYTFIGELEAKDGYVIDVTPKAVVTVSKSQSNQASNGPTNNSLINAIVSGDDDDEEEEKIEIRFVIGESKFSMNGLTSYADVAFMYNEEGDRTLVPVRFISEALGYDVGWDDPTDTVTITKDDHQIVLVIGSETMYVNGAAVQMDTAPIIYQDRTFVPIRFVAENFGLEVGFDDATQEVTLSSK